MLHLESRANDAARFAPRDAAGLSLSDPHGQTPDRGRAGWVVAL